MFSDSDRNRQYELLPLGGTWDYDTEPTPVSPLDAPAVGDDAPAWQQYDSDGDAAWPA